MTEHGSTLLHFTLWSRIVGIVLPLLIITVNSLEIHVLRKIANKHFYEKVLLSLSVCDLISGVLGIIIVPIDSILRDELHLMLFWNIWGFGICYVVLTTLVHLIIISFDRLWATGAPFHHRIYTTRKKLFVSIALSWCLPIIFVLVNIILVSTREMGVREVYSYLRNTMYSGLATIIIIADFPLFLSYCSITWIIYRTNNNVKQRQEKRQKVPINTLIICVGIVSVFILFTTPYAVIHVRAWNRPPWLVKLGIGLFPLSQISNSLIYLIQRYRSKRKVNAKMKKVQEIAMMEKRNFEERFHH